MSSQATLSLSTLEQAIEMGLREEEFEKIKEILGRTPNFCELSIFGVMWSEHYLIQKFYSLVKEIT